MGDNPETLEEELTFSLQKLEAMAMDALAVQAEVADEDAPFEVAAAAGDASVFDMLVPSYVWSDSSSDGHVTLVAAIQVRNASRRYEAGWSPSYRRRGCWARRGTAPGGSRCVTCTSAACR